MVQIQIQSRDYCDLFYLFAADKHICFDLNNSCVKLALWVKILIIIL